MCNTRSSSQADAYSILQTCDPLSRVVRHVDRDVRYSRAMTPKASSLESALAYVEKSDWTATLETLLAVWRATPHVGVADRIVKVGATFPAKEGDWLVIAEKRAPETDAKAIGTIDQARKSETAHVYSFLREYIDRAELVAAPDAPLDSDVLDKIETRLGQKTAKPVEARRADDLMAAVLANLEDDAARLVLADALIEANDPRGELITLQMSAPTPATPSRARKAFPRCARSTLTRSTRKSRRASSRRPSRDESRR